MVWVLCLVWLSCCGALEVRAPRLSFGAWLGEQEVQLTLSWTVSNIYPVEERKVRGGDAGGPQGIALSFSDFSSLEDLNTYVEVKEVVESEEQEPDTAGWVRFFPEEECSYYKSDLHFHAVLVLRSGKKMKYRITAQAQFRLGSGSHRLQVVAPNTQFVAPQKKESFSFGITGDLGGEQYGLASLERLEQWVRSGEVDFILHAGDIGYADNAWVHDYSFLWDTTGARIYTETQRKWMDVVSAISGQVPYMVCPGNHESDCHDPWCLLRGECRQGLGNFAAFRCLWRGGIEGGKTGLESKIEGLGPEGPQSSSPMWYSFDYGPAHFVALNTETDFPLAPEEGRTLFGIKSGAIGKEGEYLRWLEQDLAEASKREDRPWIITFGHRPFHSEGGRKESRREGDLGRECFWDPLTPRSGRAVCDALEDLVAKYSDFHIAGHDHFYSRLAPSPSTSSPLSSSALPPLEGSSPSPPPSSYRPVNVVVGGSGCDEWPYRWVTSAIGGRGARWDWLSFGEETSVGRMRVAEEELSFELVSSASGKVVDVVKVKRRNSERSDEDLPSLDIYCESKVHFEDV